jgi:hypothetical protein
VRVHVIHLQMHTGILARGIRPVYRDLPVTSKVGDRAAFKASVEVMEFKLSPRGEMAVHPPLCRCESVAFTFAYIGPRFQSG